LTTPDRSQNKQLYVAFALKTWGFRARQPLHRQHSADFTPLALICDHTRNSCDHKCRFSLDNPVFLRKNCLPSIKTQSYTAIRLETKTGPFFMNIHEYQAKALLRSYGAPVSEGRVVLKAEMRKQPQARWTDLFGSSRRRSTQVAAARVLSKKPTLADKGGVRLTKSVEEAAEEAKKMLGRTLVTPPDRPRGQTGQPHLHRRRFRASKPNCTSRCWWIAQTSRIGFVCSTEGGMDIEEVAESTPEKNHQLFCRPRRGLPALPRPSRCFRPRA